MFAPLNFKVSYCVKDQRPAQRVKSLLALNALTGIPVLGLTWSVSS